MTLPATATPFSESQWHQLQQWLRQLDTRQTLWLSGYLAAGSAGDAAPAGNTATQPAVLIAHGGETGNSRGLAEQLAGQARAAGIAVEVEDLARLRVRQLAKHTELLLICSTHGDGDPPEPVVPFHDALMADSAPRLPELRFAVLALGDSSYEQFCVTGQQFDKRLAALGAQRLLPCQLCDVDFQQPARAWCDAILPALPRQPATAAPAITTAAAPAGQYSKQQPLSVEVLENINLSAAGRDTPIHHLELALEVEDFTLSPGDAVGILADNPPSLVAAILDGCTLSGEAPVSIDGQSMPLVQALRQHRDLTIASPRFLTFWAALGQSPALREQTEAPAPAQRQFLKQVQVLDLILQAPATPDPQALVDALRPLQPRLYDVANSLAALGDELHLTVKAYHYPFGTRREQGIASRYLLALEPGDRLLLYPHRNARFHLPEAPQTPVILIAEGTGIAPYRAFVQDIGKRGPKRDTWLVFAEQQFEQDFLYQSELQQAHASGALTRVDTVFYQDSGETLAAPLVREQTLLAGWLERGAHVYFCGDKARLGDCENALAALVGADVWKQLGKDKRLHRNLY